MGISLPDTSQLPEHVAVIGGESIKAGAGATHAHIYPGNGQVTAEWRMTGRSDVEMAVAAARSAHPAWRDMPGNKRRNLLLKLADLIEANAAHLSSLATVEMGAPAMTAPYIPPVAADRFRYYAGWTDKLRGETLNAWNGPAHNYVDYEPYGVVGAIIPWNGPLFAAAMVMAPALAAGNCVIIKSPELAPYSVMRLAELFLEAGFPPGVVNMVLGGAETGEAIVAHPGVDKVQFVGSSATARKVLISAAQTLKPCALELGGKSAVIVFADANITAAAKRGMTGAISVSGQGCVNGTRLLIERPIYEAYLATLQAILPHISVGDPTDPGTVMGPLISQAAIDRVQSIVEKAQREGARLVAGGERLRSELADGYFIPPTVLADVDPQSALAQQEVFGPVLSVTPFDTEDEAIALANDTEYGLGAYIHTRDLRRAHQVASQMRAGMVQVNASGEGMQPFAPFGGYKQSGFGRLGGEQGLLEFLQVKNVWMNLANEERQL